MNQMDLLASGKLTDSFKSQFRVGHDTVELTFVMPNTGDGPFPHPDLSVDEFDRLKAEIATSSLYNLIGPRNLLEIRDIVISGGEPFANMEAFRSALECVCKIPHKNLYVNTSLPLSSADEAIEEINRNNNITAVNISRHFNKFYDEFAPKEKIIQINKPIRVNCILGSGWVEKEDLLQYFFDFSPLGRLVFRDSYCDSANSINAVDDDTVREFDSAFGYMYSQWGICEHIDYFYHNVELHRNSVHTSFMMGSCRLINDLIITADGKILFDWEPSCVVFDEDGNPMPQMYVGVDTTTSSGSSGVWSEPNSYRVSVPGSLGELHLPMVDTSSSQILSQLNYKELPTTIGTTGL